MKPRLAVVALVLLAVTTVAAAACAPQRSITLRHISSVGAATATPATSPDAVETSTLAAAPAAPMRVTPRWGEGWIALTARTCGSSATWRAQQARNGGVGLMYGRSYIIDCSAPATHGGGTAPAPSSTWLYPLANSPCGRNFGQLRPGNDGRYGTADDYAHQGVDIPSPTGTVVRAARAGTVTFADWNGSAGQQVQINHGGGWVTKYNHLSYINVRAGQSVAQGQHIGSVGSTGRSTGPHLHGELWRNGQLQNPTGILAPRC